MAQRYLPVRLTGGYLYKIKSRYTGEGKLPLYVCHKEKAKKKIHTNMQATEINPYRTVQPTHKYTRIMTVNWSFPHGSRSSSFRFLLCTDRWKNELSHQHPHLAIANENIQGKTFNKVLPILVYYYCCSKCFAMKLLLLLLSYIVWIHIYESCTSARTTSLSQFSSRKTKCLWISNVKPIN